LRGSFLGGTGWIGATTCGDITNADREINARDTNAVVARMSADDLKSWAGVPGTIRLTCG